MQKKFRMLHRKHSGRTGLAVVLLFLMLIAAVLSVPAVKAEPAPGSEEEAELLRQMETEVQGEMVQEPAGSEEMLEGEGMLSPSSKQASESVFGEASSEQMSEKTDEKMQTMISQLQNSLPSGNGDWAVYVYDLVNQSEGSINEHPMQAASLIKLYIMGAVYEVYDSLIAQYGQDSVDSNLYYMITVSDNDCANTLVSYLGGGDTSAGMNAVNAFCMAHGFTSSSMGRLLLQSNEFGDNYTSVMDCGRFMRAVYAGNSDEYPHADDMLSLLASQQRRHKIPSQIPGGVSVANKTGELSDVENDAGIIYNTPNDVVLVFMSEHLADVGAAQSTIGSLSRQIYDYYCQS